MSTDTSQPEPLPFEPTPSLEDLHIGRVYAEALLNAAEKQNAVDDVQGELHELVREVFRRDPQIEEFLASGIISEEHKEHALKDSFKDRVHPLLYNFLMVLCRHGRLALLRAIDAEFNRIFNQRQRRISVRVRSAVPLNDDQLGRLKSDLHKTFQLEPMLDVQIDPGLLGGLVVRVGDWLFDHSVRTELQNLRRQLIAQSNFQIQTKGKRFSSDGE
jgi:F-type H+-transporting ATPase subunit delta